MYDIVLHKNRFYNGFTVFYNGFNVELKELFVHIGQFRNHQNVHKDQSINDSHVTVRES